MGFKDALAKQKPFGTAKYTFDTLTFNCDEAPVFEVRHAGCSNPTYESAFVRLGNETKPMIGKNTVKKERETIEHNCRLFALGGVIVGWKNVREDPPATDPIAPCTPEKIEELLVSLIDNHREVLADFFRFCRTAENFRDGEAGSGLELGKK